MDLFDARRDANLGQALIRLAHLAAAQHRYQRAAALIGGAAGDDDRLPDSDHQLGNGIDLREEHGRIEGLDPWTAAASDACASGASRACTDARSAPRSASGSASDHTEVDR